jgi:hypothetical protein
VCLGRQSQARNFRKEAQRVQKVPTPRTSRPAGDRPVTLARPFKNTVPTLGTKCGRRERGVGAGDRQEQSCRSIASVTVEDILVFGKTALFAGRRRNADLGRSVELVGVSSLAGGRTGDSGCPLAPRRGTPSACAHKAHAPDARAEMPLALRGRVLHSVQRPVHVNHHSTSLVKANERGALELVSRSGKPAQAGGTGTGIGTSGRSAARRGSLLPKGGDVIRQNRKEVAASVPARIVSSGSCPHVVMHVAEVGRRRLVSNKLGKRAPKRADRVE